MEDRFADKAHDWDTRPVPQQISEGVFAAIQKNIAFEPSWTALDFGAGTGLVATKVAAYVKRIVAVDISKAMLEQLANKPELAGKADVYCQDIVQEGLGLQVNIIVSAMAMHHVNDTRALLSSLHAHLLPGGFVALADLDSEDGTFHPAEAEGVFHAGFDRQALSQIAADAGFVDIRFDTACEVDREHKRYPVFLMTAKRT